MEKIKDRINITDSDVKRSKYRCRLILNVTQEKKDSWKLEAKKHNLSLTEYATRLLDGEVVDLPPPKANKKSKAAVKRIKANYCQIVDATHAKHGKEAYSILNTFQSSMMDCFQRIANKLRNRNLDDETVSKKIDEYGRLVNGLAHELNLGGFVLPAEYTTLCLKFEKLLGELS